MDFIFCPPTQNHFKTSVPIRHISAENEELNDEPRALPSALEARVPSFSIPFLFMTDRLT
jgi:hypothetical protein